METTKSKITHKIQFGRIVYDAIKVTDNKYLLLFEKSKSRQGELVDNGICWKRNYGYRNLSQQTKPYNLVLIIKK